MCLYVFLAIMKRKRNKCNQFFFVVEKESFTFKV
jgi:hypothetical protein